MIDSYTVLRWFANELNERMIKERITARQLSYVTRLSLRSINGYLDGNSFPNMWSLSLMAEQLHCTVDDLLGYKKSRSLSRTKRAPLKTTFTNEDAYTMYLRECVKDRMQTLGIDAKELAQISGVSYSSINRYLCVHSGLPQTHAFLHICDALDCTPSELSGY